MNLKSVLSKKLKKTGGFTLIEMLIVVAIIAILVAVSIPMVSASLDKAKRATDDANERAAKAAALLAYMNDMETATPPTLPVTYCYNADTGAATQKPGSGACTVTGTYGQGSKKTDASTEQRKGHVHVTITAAGETTVAWSGS